MFTYVSIEEFAGFGVVKKQQGRQLSGANRAHCGNLCRCQENGARWLTICGAPIWAVGSAIGDEYDLHLHHRRGR